jgi:RND family efflux transporter MFP subunit
MEAVKTQLALARTVYERQENLWKQNIGTEVQLLQVKSNVEGLQNQLKTMQENVKLAQEQLSQSNVYSNVSGVADEVNIHVGETFTGSPANGIKIVNTRDLKVVVDVPENYLSRVRKGTPVEITVPDINRNYSSKISLISQSISETSRGFIAEAKIPYDARLKPNLIAIARILDYSVPNAIAIPVNTLQTDEKGKFVLVASKEGDKLIARKRVIQLGELYGDKIEIKQGLKAGDNVITEGFQALYDGQPITIG